MKEIIYIKVKGIIKMTKQQYKDMKYKELKNNSDDEIDTMYKRFDNGNMWIVQFNEEYQEDEIGKVYLTKEQVDKIFS